MKSALKRQIRALGVELLVYSVLILGYLFLVVHFFGEQFHQLFLHDRKAYAWIALVVVAAQGLLLETLTRVLLHFLKPQRGGVE